MSAPDNRKIHLEGKRIYLETLDDSHATAAYSSWLRDQDVTRYLDRVDAEPEALRAYIRQKNKSPDTILLGIFDKESKQHIGNIKLEPVGDKGKTPRMGIILGEKTYWGKGIGAEAIELFASWAFDKLGMDSIEAGCVKDNARSINVFKKAGFKIEGGVRRNWVMDRGTVCDAVFLVRKKTTTI